MIRRRGLVGRDVSLVAGFEVSKVDAIPSLFSLPACGSRCEPSSTPPVLSLLPYSLL